MGDIVIVVDQDLVSIIIPVYNVEKYLDDCINSVVNQSYKNIEIVLVNDGSTDSSYEICNEWSKKDDRIRLLNQINQGQGIARNYGVREAKGDWIAFIDSDDWIDKEYIELMMQAIVRECADMAKCNYTQIRTKSKDQKTTNFYQTIGIMRDEKYILAESAGVIWNLIIRKKIIIDNKIEQPKCKGQDSAVGLEMCLLAKKIAFVNDSLYFYRKEREGATTDGATSKRDELALIALPWLIKGLQKCKLYCNYREVIQRYIAHNLTLTLWGGWLNLEQKKYDELKNLYFNSFQTLVGVNNKIIATFGSWNLTETAKKMPFVQDMDYAFHFSGIISLMSKCNPNVVFFHKNIYRNKMIKKDVFSNLWDVFELRRPDYFVIDLLEERNDVIQYSKGCITKSVAVSQAEIDYCNATILKFGSDAWLENWKQSFDEFADKIQYYVPANKIFIVKNLLTERYGNVFENYKYQNVDEIRNINKILESCYQYVTDILPNCKVIDLTKDDKYITDEKYEYGVEPYYINSFINEKVGEIILENIKNDYYNVMK